MKSLLVTLMLLLSAPIFTVHAGSATADGQTDTDCHAINSDVGTGEAPTSGDSESTEGTPGDDR